MHELSLAESALGVIERAARRDGFDRVRVVRLEIGVLACVELDALELAFEVASRGTCAAGARLVVVPVPGRGECPRCATTVPMDREPDLCRECQGPLRVVDGTQLRVKDLDVE